MSDFTSNPFGAYTLVFTRMERGELATLALVLVEASHELLTCGDPEEAMLAAITRGVTSWVKETPEGRKAFDDSSEDLNVGDLCHYQDETPELASRLEKQGIRLLSIDCNDGGGDLNFDAVLVDTEMLDEVA